MPAHNTACSATQEGGPKYPPARVAEQLVNAASHATSDTCVISPESTFGGPESPSAASALAVHQDEDLEQSPW